jgi:ATPase subunit of ABC transporter with duplicated ATPase domains
MRYGLLIKSKNDELLIFDEPTNYLKSIYDIDSKKWLETMKYKMDFMYTNHI